MKPFIVSTAESRFWTQAMSKASRSASSPVWYQRMSALSAAASDGGAYGSARFEMADDRANLGVIAAADAIDLFDDAPSRLTTRELSG